MTLTQKWSFSSTSIIAEEHSKIKENSKSVWLSRKQICDFIATIVCYATQDYAPYRCDLFA